MTGEVLFVRDARQLLELADLSDIVYYQLLAQRKDEADEPEKQVDIGAGDVDGEVTPLQVLARHDASHIEVRVRTVSESSVARYVVDVGARFELSRPLDIEPQALKEFVERVGVMAAYPYVREGLSDLAGRLRLPVPLLKLLRGNEIQLEATSE